MRPSWQATAAELAAELHLMADWLELHHVVEGNGDLAPALSRAVDPRR